MGLYFFSQAITPEEAAEEAQWLVDAAQDFKIDMPLVFDWENIDPSSVASGDTVRTAEMTGAKNAETAKQAATMTEVRPVRPPAAMPAEDST